MDILNLPGWRLLSVDENEYDYRMIIEREEDTVRTCYHCGTIGEFTRFGKLSQLVMDLPIHAKRVGLEIQRQRYRCKACGKTFLSNLGEGDIDENRAATTRLIEYIEKQSLIRTFTSIANDIGINEKTVRNIFKEYVAALEYSIEFETPEIMGIDELTLMREPRCIITNVKERTVVELLETRKKTAVLAYLSRLRNKARIQVVAMDMWNPYKEAVQVALPGVPIVVDKFHIVRMANVCLEDVRKAVRHSLTDRQRRTLMHDRFILLRRRAELTIKDEIKLQSWLGTFPELATAYTLKEQFFDIWNATSADEAAELYIEWQASIPEDLTPYFKPIVTAVGNWHDEIFAYFQYGAVTNAYTEAVNGLAKLTNKIGRGYSFEAIRAKLLYGNGLKKTQGKPKYDKRLRSSGVRSVDYAGVDDYSYTSMGNEISTLTQQLEGETDSSGSTS